MEEKFDIASLVFIALVKLLVVYRTFQLSIGNKKLKQLIKHHYLEKRLTIISIDRLTLVEKLKYGVSMSIFRFYQYYFGFITGKIEYVRKIEVKDKNNSLILKYIELQIRNRKLISVNEFDKFEQ